MQATDVPDWRFGAMLFGLAAVALVAGAQTCSRALPVCTGLTWVVLWGIGTLGLFVLAGVQAFHRQAGQAALSVLLLAGAVAWPLADWLT